MDAKTEDVICGIITHNNIDDLDRLLCDYNPLWIVEVCVSNWIMDQDKVIYILTKYKHLYTDGWLMDTCAFDLETYILEGMHKMGIDLNAEFEYKGAITNYFTEMCKIKLGFNKSSFIISDNIRYLHKIKCVYLDSDMSKVNSEAQFYLAKTFTC
jgi:hypothetical protein